MSYDPIQEPPADGSEDYMRMIAEGIEDNAYDVWRDNQLTAFPEELGREPGLWEDTPFEFPY